METYTSDRELAVKAQEIMDYVNVERHHVAALVDNARVMGAQGPDVVPGHVEDFNAAAMALLEDVSRPVTLVKKEGPPNIRIALPGFLVRRIGEVNQQAMNLDTYKNANPDGGPLGGPSLALLEDQIKATRETLAAIVAQAILVDLAGVADACHY